MNNNKLGVIVGRFQVDQLTEGHKYFIDTVLEKCQHCLIFIGESPTRITTKHPLPFKIRKAMILSEYPLVKYPSLSIIPLDDCKEDFVWSRNIDTEVDQLIEFISEFKGEITDITLYGSRDSFINSYNGKYNTSIIEPKDPSISATSRRDSIYKSPSICERAFREGLIYASLHKYPTVYPVVDILVYDLNTMRMLLGKKHGEIHWRLIGGFVDKADQSLEQAAIRELSEEAPNITTTSIRYLLSQPVSDWRYKDTNDSIMTSLFLANYLSGTDEAGDDLEVLEWFNLDSINYGFLEKIVPEHQSLIKKAVEVILNNI